MVSGGCFASIGCGSSVTAAGATIVSAPRISQVQPALIPVGSPTQTIHVAGTSFGDEAVILWNGNALKTTKVDASTLAGSVDSSVLVNPSTAQLQVQNTSDGQQSVPVAVTVAATDVASPAPLSIAPVSLPGGIQGAPYLQPLQANGGTPGYSWSVSAGSLPAGLTLSPAGVISGTPTTTVTFNKFTATLTDTSKPVQSKSITTSILVAPPASAGPSALTITSSSLVAGNQGTPYSQALQANGGTPGYSWSVSAGSLPAGLALAPTGIISGTPTAAASFNKFTATVTDSSSPAQSKSITTSIVVSASALTITSSNLAAGTRGTAYSQSLQAAGGTSAYSWSVSAGSLPAGLTLASTGVVSGTPTASGTSAFTATVTDSSKPAQSKSIATSIVVSASALTITSSNLAAGTRGTAYSQSLQAAGGTSAYSWSVSAGSLPAGLTLASTGVVSGTPTASGTSAFTATVTDSSKPAQSKSIATSIVVSASALTITSSNLAAGTRGTAYSQSLQAAGGTSAYSWSVSAGSLPAGLTLASTGVVSGTPTASGTSAFTATVTDSSKPAQSKSATSSITIASTALSITSSSFVSGTDGTNFAQSLSASGGTPGYVWTISAGSLPPGLTLAATTGVVSGTPNVAGTFNFTASVADSSSPAQSKSAASSIVIAAATASGPGTTWYIRPDGGTRYSARQTNGQCDGKADAPYGGVGTNQHCAYSDYRYLWDDQSYNNRAWVISGGDTVILRGGPWRVGWDANTGPGAGGTWCYGADNIGCVNPAIPAGTASQHTRILGENYASCGESNKTQIFGGFGVITAVNLSGAQYVDVQCLDITRHSNCMSFGSPVYPSSCSSSAPVDDFDSDGIHTDIATHDLLMQDLYIHGHVGRGIKGPIGGLVTCLRCVISYNGAAGWDFDDGSATPFPAGAIWKFNYSTIEWSGCNQEYPVVSTFPAMSCYGQSTGGYGDGVGTAAGTGLDVSIDHSTFRYNTQDGLDLGHVDSGSHTLNITNSTAYGNSGGTFKWGANFTTATVLNNEVIGNCLRMSAPIPGAPSTYNANLADFCRAQDAVSFNLRQGGTALLANNTIVSYAPTTFDIACWDTSCSASTLTFKNNIVLGYNNPTTLDMGGQAGGPGNFYFQAVIGNIVRSNNIFYGVRNTDCPTGNPGEMCLSPLLENQPTWVDETSLDHFNFNLTSGSPARGAGVTLPSVPLDYNGVRRASPPSIGAIE